MKATWHSVDLRSGRRGAPLQVRGNPPVSRVLNEATEVSLDVYIDLNGQPAPDWEAATRPRHTMVVAVDDADRVIWGGYVYRRIGNKGNYVTLTLQTLEGYLDRRFLNNDAIFKNADQVSDIARQVIRASNDSGILFAIDAPYSNWKRDRTYLIDEDKTFFSILSELAGLEDGIEFTVDLEWSDDSHLALLRIFRVRNRLGTAYLGSVGTDTASPIAEFHLPGSVKDFTYLEDYSPEFGANAVVAVSSGEGDGRPESAIHVSKGVALYTPGGEEVMFEKRFTPSTSITDTDTLDAHAIRELQQTWDGLQEIELEVNVTTGPRLNVDWFLGDDVSVVLTCPRFPERTNADGDRAPGYVATMRVIGWELDFENDSVKPKVTGLTPVEVIKA